MELEIFWSRFAEDKSQDIFKYYKINTGIRIARGIIAQNPEKMNETK